MPRPRLALTILAALFLLLGAHHASATAIVDVRAFASVNFLGNVTDPDFNPVDDPGVITATCDGVASNGCSVAGQVVLSRVTPGRSTQTDVSRSTFEITNTADQTLLVDLFFGFSSFNPGGPQIGAKVDDPVTEFASFDSIAGFDFIIPDIPGLFTDQHNCETSPAHPACGVGAPDSNEGEFLVTLAPGGNAIIQPFVTIHGVAAVSVPEPGALGPMAAGLLCLGMIFARRRLPAS